MTKQETYQYLTAHGIAYKEYSEPAGTCNSDP